MKPYKILILLLLFCVPFKSEAQKLLWDIDFMGFFDNREFKAPYQTPQTFFGTRLSPEIGVEIRDKHRLKFGLSWIAEFDADKTSEVDWTVYYGYTDSRLTALFGSFPRRLLAQELPPALMYDSILYFNPNINGALFRYTARSGYAEMYIDWRSRQGEQKREIFTMATDGQFSWKRGFAGWYATVNHFAKSKNSEGQNVIDNIIGNPYLGVDLSRLTFMDSLTIRGGAIISANRNRGDGVWHTPVGFLGELTAEWRFLGLKNVVYAGDNQLTFYDEFGAMLHCGDPFYRAPFYDRLDFYVYFLRNRFVDCKACVSLHFVDGKVQNQQQLLLRFKLDQDMFKWPKRKINQ